MSHVRGASRPAWSRSAVSVVISAGILIVGPPTPASASPGDLDPSFGSNGRASIPAPATGFRVTDVDVDAEGRVLISGYRYDAATDRDISSVVRLLSGGGLDTAFGSGGTWTSETPATGPHVVPLPDGRVVVAFATTIVRGDRGRPAVRIVALDAEGSPDPSFGEGGTQTIATGPAGPWWCYGGAVGDVAPAPDGDLVIAATHVTDCAASFPAQRGAAVIRLRSDGSREATFAGDGVGSYPLWSVDECCYITPIDVLVGERGQLSWVGSVQRARDGYEEWQQNLMVVRVDRTGDLVTTYGDQGIARLTGWDVSAAATSASGLPGGAVVVAGRGGLGWDQYYGPRLVVRFGPRGRPDPTFSSDGVWRGGDRSDPGEPVGTWVDPAGRITAAWSTGDYFGARAALILCRILPAGTLDRTFGSEGCLRIRSPSAWWSQGPEPAPGRKLVIAGYGGPTSQGSTSIEVVRLLTT